ncbi:MAG: hypothetical protein Q8R14_03035 [Candidatus Omnitrophota bacterium]|nr:hypothetical protein [Candidatus Omnitrophota bacterium]
MKRILIFTMIILSISFMAVDYAYSAMDDKSDRLSNDQAGIFSPGYINATKQKTDSIINQLSKPGNSIENTTEYAKDELGDNVKEDALDKPVPELKKKTGGSNENPKAAAQFSENVIEVAMNTVNSDIKIGTGDSKAYDASGRMISEVIEGKRCVYAGFDDIGKATIQDAISIAQSGDSVIVKTGTYDLSYTIGYRQERKLDSKTGRWVLTGVLIAYNDYTRPQSLTLKDGVSLYGGYNESGARDISGTPTIISGGLGIKGSNISKYTEINGFTIKSQSNGSFTGAISISNSSNVTIANNNFEALSGSLYEGRGVSATSSSLAVKNNVFNVILGLYVLNSSVVSAANNQFNGESGIYASDSKVSSEYNNFNTKLNGITILMSDSDYSYTRGYGIYSFQDYFKANPHDWDFDNNLSYVENTLQMGIRFGEDSGAGKWQDSAYARTYALSPKFTSDIVQAATSPFNYNRTIEYETSKTLLFNASTGTKEVEANVLASIFKGLLNSRNNFSEGQQGMIDKAALDLIVGNAVKGSAIAPAIDGTIMHNPAEMEIAVMLASILKNPTEDQKMILDAVTSLLNEVNKQSDGSESPELKKAQDDLLQVAAAVLIAQAIPDLLKEGDVANIKNIFSELNNSKGKIILDYQGSTKPYYDELVKELSKNMSILQLKNILSNNMTDEELAKLPRNEIDKIFEKLKQAKDKSFEAEYLLQQEAKYRKAYIDPNKKVLEENMKAMMRDFTQRLSKTLEGAGSAKK